MILILVSWLIMAAFFGVWGTALSKWIRFELPFGGSFFLGMMAQTVLLTSAAFFHPVDGVLFVINALVTAILAYVFRYDILSKLSVLRQASGDFGRREWLVFGLALVVTLWKSAQLPFVIDNDTYYLQTIKWLHEYGLVKGLANLNVAFGQTSPWQILQSGFDFPFTGWPLNDLNGFIFIVFVLIILTLKQEVTMRYVLLFSVVLLQFVSAPSPDLPVILSLLLALTAYSKGDQKWLALLLIYAVFLKITALPFALLLVWIMWKREISVRFLFCASLPFVVLWIAKNMWLTGYPLFPSTIGGMGFDWTVPKSVASSLGDMVRNHEFRGQPHYRTLGWSGRLLAWAQTGGLERVFNWGMLLALVTAPFLRWREVRFRPIFTVCLMHFAFILTVSPQYRFFLPEFIFLWVVIIGILIQKAQINKTISTALLGAALIVPLALPVLLGGRPLTGNGKMAINDRYALSLIVWPDHVTRFPALRFEKERIGNLRYWTPTKDAYFHTTGNGPLPCTNRRIIQSNARKYGVIPELRTPHLRDGFRSIPASEWDTTN